MNMSNSIIIILLIQVRHSFAVESKYRAALCTGGQNHPLPYLTVLNFYYACLMLLSPIGHTEYKMYRLIAKSILL